MMTPWVKCEKPEASSYRIEADEHGLRIMFSPCGVTSWHPKDIENRYCAYCHCFISWRASP